MCLSDFILILHGQDDHIWSPPAVEDTQDFSECVCACVRAQVQFCLFYLFFFGSHSRCLTARAADSTRLWMCRVKETLPYHICQEQLKPDLSPCQHCRHFHSVHSEEEAIVWGSPGGHHPKLFLHTVTATSCHSSFFVSSFFPEEKRKLLCLRANSGLKTCFSGLQDCFKTEATFLYIYKPLWLYLSKDVKHFLMLSFHDFTFPTFSGMEFLLWACEAK